MPSLKQRAKICHLQTHNPSAGLSIVMGPPLAQWSQQSGSFWVFLWTTWNYPSAGPTAHTGLTVLLSQSSPHLPFSHQRSLKCVISSHVSPAFTAPNKHRSGHATPVFMPCAWGGGSEIWHRLG